VSWRSTALFAVVGAAALVGGGRIAEAGPSYSLGRKAVCAEAAVEVEIAFTRSAGDDRLVERAAAERRAFPAQVRERALAGARVLTSFYESPTTPSALPKPLDVYLSDRVWRAGYQRGHLRALLFVRRIKGKPQILFGVEGLPTDVDADYPEVRAAVARYARWRERPGDSGAIAEAEKTRASTSNPAVSTLASAFLCAAGHRDGTAAGPCPPPTESCSEW
jgi:hypothetical protein